MHLDVPLVLVGLVIQSVLALAIGYWFGKESRPADTVTPNQYPLPAEQQPGGSSSAATPPRTQKVSGTGKVDGLPDGIRARLVEQFPAFTYIQ